MEWVESTGASIDEAKERALDRLGVHTDDAEFEIVSDVKTGLFGRIKEEARVRARVAPATPRGKDERKRGRGRGNRSGGGGGGRGRDGNKQGNRQGNKQGNKSGSQGNRQGNKQGGQKSGGRENTGRDSASQENAGRRNDGGGNRSDNRAPRDNQQEKKMSDDEATMPLPEQADLAEEFVTGLAERFGTSVTFDRTEVDEEEIRITVSGEGLGRMVGRRGTTAGAIDELVRTVLQRQAGSSRNGRIRVDIGGVRAKRAEALARFAQAQAAEVRSSGTARSLEPMSAADRKVVHDAVTDEEGVDTISEGEDSQRRVVIVPAEG